VNSIKHGNEVLINPQLSDSQRKHYKTTIRLAI